MIAVPYKEHMNAQTQQGELLCALHHAICLINRMPAAEMEVSDPGAAGQSLVWRVSTGGDLLLQRRAAVLRHQLLQGGR
jgi:hypothetical protein